jgi:hypothetical protein
MDMLNNVAFKYKRAGEVSVWMIAIALLAALVMGGFLAPPAHAFSTFTVNRTGNQSDVDATSNTCDIDLSTTGNQCTLRAAIQQANANNNPSEVDRINFNISGTGVHTISPGSPLPTITEPVAINGYSQPGASVNTLSDGTNARLLIQLKGTNSGASGAQGGLNVVASNSVVKGLIINRFLKTDAIDIGPETSADVAANIRIEGNFLGIDPSGTIDKGNGSAGIFLFAGSNNTIGGNSPAARNLISGNDLAGVFIEGGGFNTFPSADNNKVQGNLIGTQKDGIKALGNGGQGIDVIGDAQGNRILTNAIFSNGALGIDLDANGRTANDPGDTDIGPNDLQNKPLVGSAKTISGNTVINGTLNSRPRATYTIQFFSNPSGTDEGETLIGQKTGLAVDGTGHASFAFSPTNAVAVGQVISATATNENTHDTSEFSAPKTVSSS